MRFNFTEHKLQISLAGPGATKRAFLYFMGHNSTVADEIVGKYSKPSAGTYVGASVFGNRSVSVFGSRRTCNDYVIRTAIAGSRKMGAWRAMNITNYQGVNKQPSGKSCIMSLHEHYSNLYLKETELLQEIHRRRW